MIRKGVKKGEKLSEKDGEKGTKKGLENDLRREWASKIFYLCLTPHLVFSSSPSSPLLFFLSSLFSFSFFSLFFISTFTFILFSYLHSFFSCPLSFSFFLFFPTVNVTSSVGLATFFLFIAQVFISNQKLNYPFLDMILNFTVYFNYYYFFIAILKFRSF